MEDCGKVWILMFFGTNWSFKPWVPLAYTSLSSSCSQKWNHTALVPSGSGSYCKTQFPHFQNPLPEALKPLLHLCQCLSWRMSGELCPPDWDVTQVKLNKYLINQSPAKLAAFWWVKASETNSSCQKPCKDSVLGQGILLDKAGPWLLCTAKPEEQFPCAGTSSVHPCWAEPLLPVPPLPNCPWFLCGDSPLHTLLVSGGKI